MYLRDNNARLRMPDQQALEARRGDAYERILAAAKELFMEKGFSKVSTDEVCKHASVSKTSLYKYFGDMSGLLEDVVRKELESRLPEYHPLPNSREELSKCLYGIGHDVAELLSDPELLELDRMALEIARSHPKIGEIYNHIAFELFQQHIGDLLKHAQEQGFLELRADPYDSADHLLSIWDGLGLMKVRLGLAAKPYDDMHKWFKQGIWVLFGLEEAS